MVRARTTCKCSSSHRTARYCIVYPATGARWISREHNLHAYVSAQDEYSLIARHIELEKLPAIEAHGMGLLPYFPLASGLLTDRQAAKRGVGGEVLAYVW